MSDRPYITERTRMWRSRDIKPWFVEAIDTIENTGTRTCNLHARLVGR